jgi:uncharacterized protein (DUF3820 family)
MLTGCSNPFDDGLSLAPFRTRQAADLAIPRYQGRHIYGLPFEYATTIENRSFGFDEGALARLALVALAACFHLAHLSTTLRGGTIPYEIVV